MTDTVNLSLLCQLLDAQVRGGEAQPDPVMLVEAAEKQNDACQPNWIALEQFGCGIVRHNAPTCTLYSKPMFIVQGFDMTTTQGIVAAGIRQGFQLSPYLFILVLSAILLDMDQTLHAQGTPCNTWSEGRPIYDVEYVDDTLLLALTTAQMQPFSSGT